MNFFQQFSEFLQSISLKILMKVQAIPCLIMYDYLVLYFKNRMNFFSQIFGNTSPFDLSNHINQTLLGFKMDTLQPLPQNYIEKNLQNIDRRCKQEQVFTQILKQINIASSAPSLIKLLTIVFQFLRKQNYAQSYLEQLEELNLRCPKNFQNSQDKWLKDLAISCITFLGRVSSFGDVFRRALNPHKDLFTNQTLSVDLLRLMNLYSLLFPHLSNAVNTVGRYYKKSYLFFEQFYNILRSWLFTGYQYMKYICDKFMNFYNQITIQTIKLFNSIIPEVELLCDKMQQYMVSKYYKGKGMSKKIYFSDDKIQEIKYYLQNQTTYDFDKEAEQFDTADSEYFTSAKAHSYI